MSRFPSPPPPPPPWDEAPRSLTPVTGATALLAIYVVAAYLSYAALRPFPNPVAFWTLLGLVPLAAAVGALVGSIRSSDVRVRSAVMASILTIVAPFALAAWVPGVAQDQQHPLPGGGDIVMAAEPDGNVDLYLIVDGDPDRTIALTDTPVRRERFPSLSPDGRTVVFAADAPDGSADLFLMTLGADHRPSSTRLLLDGPDNLSETSWAPDGRSILVRSDVEGAADLYRYDVDDANLEPFLEGAFNAMWSPDGEAIAFAAFSPDQPGDADIFVADAEGRHRRLVVDTGFDDASPVWSPDGRRLAFASEVQGGDLDVFVVNIDGSGLRILTPDHDGYDEPFLWGPRGDILFLSDRNDIGGVFGYLMDPDGSNVRLFNRL